MSLLNNVKSKWKISKLKERVEQEPSPGSIGELARFYIQCGDEDAAYALVTEHAGDYPESEILKQLRNYLVKRKVNDKVKEAVQTLQEGSNPESYLSIIETYRQHHDLGTAMEYARRFVADYPQSALAHRLLGELRFDRFSEDYSAKDGRAAEESLLKAQSLDPYDLATGMALARLYFCCQLTTKARKVLEEVLAITPGDLEAKNLLNIMSSIKEDDEDPDFRFARIEERQGFYHSWDPVESKEEAVSGSETDVAETLQEQLEEMMGVDGLKTAAFIGAGDLGIEAGATGARGRATEKGTREGAFSRFASQVGEAARVASLRMDLGTFERGLVEGSGGELLVQELRGGTAAFRFEERGKVTKVYSDLMNRIDQMAASLGKIHD